MSVNVIAWIFTGLAAGPVVSHLLAGSRDEGRAAACVIGIAGALLGGWAVTGLLPSHTSINLASVISELGALTAAALALGASHTLTRRSGDPGAGLLPALVPVRPAPASR